MWLCEGGSKSYEPFKSISALTACNVASVITYLAMNMKTSCISTDWLSYLYVGEKTAALKGSAAGKIRPTLLITQKLDTAVWDGHVR